MVNSNAFFKIAVSLVLFGLDVVLPLLTYKYCNESIPAQFPLISAVNFAAFFMQSHFAITEH